MLVLVRLVASVLALAGLPASAAVSLTANVYETPGLAGYWTYDLTATANDGYINGLDFADLNGVGRGIFGPLHHGGDPSSPLYGFVDPVFGGATGGQADTHWLLSENDVLSVGPGQSTGSLHTASVFWSTSGQRDRHRSLPFARVVTNDPSAVSLNGQFLVRQPWLAGGFSDGELFDVRTALTEVTIGDPPALEALPDHALPPLFHPNPPSFVPPTPVLPPDPTPSRVVLSAEAIDTPGLPGYRTYTVTATAIDGYLNAFDFTNFAGGTKGISGPLHHGAPSLQNLFADRLFASGPADPTDSQWLVSLDGGLAIGTEQSAGGLEAAYTFTGTGGQRDTFRSLPLAQLVTNDPAAVTLSGEFALSDAWSDGSVAESWQTHRVGVNATLSDLVGVTPPELGAFPDRPAPPRPPIVATEPPVVTPPVLNTPPVVVTAPPVVTLPTGSSGRVGYRRPGGVVEPPVLEAPTGGVELTPAVVEPPVVVQPPVVPPTVDPSDVVPPSVTPPSASRVVLSAEAIDTPGLPGYRTYTVTATAIDGYLNAFDFTNFAGGTNGITGPLHHGTPSLENLDADRLFASGPADPTDSQWLVSLDDGLAIGAEQSEGVLEAAYTFTGTGGKRDTFRSLPLAQLVTNDPSAVSLIGEFALSDAWSDGTVGESWQSHLVGVSATLSDLVGVTPPELGAFPDRPVPTQPPIVVTEPPVVVAVPIESPIPGDAGGCRRGCIVLDAPFPETPAEVIDIPSVVVDQPVFIDNPSGETPGVVVVYPPYLDIPFVSVGETGTPGEFPTEVSETPLNFYPIIDPIDGSLIAFVPWSESAVYGHPWSLDDPSQVLWAQLFDDGSQLLDDDVTEFRLNDGEVNHRLVYRYARIDGNVGSDSLATGDQSPVPEPGAGLLVGVGLLAVGARRGRG